MIIYYLLLMFIYILVKKATQKYINIDNET